MPLPGDKHCSYFVKYLFIAENSCTCKTNVDLGIQTIIGIQVIMAIWH